MDSLTLIAVASIAIAGLTTGMGSIGPGATAEQAEGRVAYAGNAIRASIRMARYMTKK